MLHRTVNLETHGSRKKRRIRKMSNEKERETEKARNRVIERVMEMIKEEERNGIKKSMLFYGGRCSLCSGKPAILIKKRLIADFRRSFQVLPTDIGFEPKPNHLSYTRFLYVEYLTFSVHPTPFIYVRHQMSD